MRLMTLPLVRRPKEPLTANGGLLARITYDPHFDRRKPYYLIRTPGPAGGGKGRDAPLVATRTITQSDWWGLRDLDVLKEMVAAPSAWLERAAKRAADNSRAAASDDDERPFDLLLKDLRSEARFEICRREVCFSQPLTITDYGIAALLLPLTPTQAHEAMATIDAMAKVATKLGGLKLTQNASGTQSCDFTGPFFVLRVEDPAAAELPENGVIMGSFERRDLEIAGQDQSLTVATDYWAYQTKFVTEPEHAWQVPLPVPGSFREAFTTINDLEKLTGNAAAFEQVTIVRVEERRRRIPNDYVQNLPTGDGLMGHAEFKGFDLDRIHTGMSRAAREARQERIMRTHKRARAEAAFQAARQ